MKNKDTAIILFLIIIILGGIFAIKALTKEKDNKPNNIKTTTKKILTTTTITPTTTTIVTTTSTTTKIHTTTTKKKTETVKEPTTNKPVTKAPDYSGTTSKGYQIVTKDGITYVDGYLIANKTYSLPSTYSPGKLESKTSAAASEMFAAFKQEKGIKMWAQSGFRSYDTQKGLYERYVKRDGQAGADRYSARPGHSEHQTGLAFDVCVTGYECINSGFNGTMPANWLSDNAYKYGFILRYPKGKENETGYKYESWHFRYVGKELAQALYNDGNWITMEDYFGIDSKYQD